MAFFKFMILVILGIIIGAIAGMLLNDDDLSDKDIHDGMDNHFNPFD
jgi:hypothetical protein